MRLSRRIYDICDCVSQGESVADIGTDHGYVPMVLLKKTVINHAIMSDISEGSLAKAVETFDLAGLTADAGCFRVGDGLKTVNVSEVDDIIIAGLGGHTIVDILREDIDKSKSFRKLILQPRKHSGFLRYFLYVNGWDITEERLSPEGKFVCEIIVAVPTETSSREALYSEDDIRWAYPLTLKNADRTLLEKRVSWKLNSILEQINNLDNSKSAKGRIEDLKNNYNYLKELIEKHEEA